MTRKHRRAAFLEAYERAAHYPLQGVVAGPRVYAAAACGRDKARMAMPLILAAVMMSGGLFFPASDVSYPAAFDKALSAAMVWTAPAAKELSDMVRRTHVSENKSFEAPPGGRVSLGPALSVRDLSKSVYAREVNFRIEPLTPAQMEAHPSSLPAKKFASVKRKAVVSGEETLLASAQKALKAGRYDSAFGILKKLHARHPENAALAAQLGLVSARAGREEEAIRYMSLAAALAPEKAGYIYNVAVMVDRSGAHKKALPLYEKALETDAAYGAGLSVPRGRIYDRLYYLRRL
ncbi:MAG: tetratricopeptide repeat protein [Rhodospirillales bacterium]|nr:tetratricopeptide repeat protein [Alphaproteobacteria bacterium]USO03095.1 MAG: tetratricopeptide repeat protein [Rhodospirillales bacterium]